MTDLEHDVIRVFSLALTPAARHHLELNYDSIALIRAACEHQTPTELARIVSVGIGWHTPINPWPVMRYRIARAAGHDMNHHPHDDMEMTD